MIYAAGSAISAMGLFAKPSMSCGRAGCVMQSAILADEELLETIYHALQRRRPRSRTMVGLAHPPKWC